MNRIFPVLAGLALALLVVAMMLGLSIGDLYSNQREEVLTAIRQKNVHFLVGLTAALCVVLVESILVTYFVGTSRWCREVSETYKLDVDYIRRGNALKRRAFPYAVTGMLIAVGISALGAAADPTAALRSAPWGLPWRQWHLLGALLGTAAILGTFVGIWIPLEKHRRLIAEIVAEVRKIRAAKGLDD